MTCDQVNSGRLPKPTRENLTVNNSRARTPRVEVVQLHHVLDRRLSEHCEFTTMLNIQSGKANIWPLRTHG